MTALPVAAGKPQTDHTTPFSEPWLRSLKSALGTAAGRPILMGGRKMTEEQRRRISSFRRAILARLSPQPGNDRAVAVVIAKLLSAFPVQGQSDTPTELRMETYFDALDGMPAWAVDEACRAIVRGETGLDGRFAPTPPQLAAATADRMRQLRADLRDLDTLLKVEVEADESPEAKARVAAGFDALRRELRLQAPSAIDEAQAQARFIALCREAGVDPKNVPDQPPQMQPLAWSGETGERA